LLDRVKQLLNRLVRHDRTPSHILHAQAHLVEAPRELLCVHYDLTEAVRPVMTGRPSPPS
jgi:hypothetical protein